MYTIKIITILFLCIFSTGCTTKPKATIDENQNFDSIKPLASNSRGIAETLNPEALKKVEGWHEYEQLDQLITKFYTAEPEEALNLSTELATSTQQLKDSLQIERFLENDVMIRINVLNNYALRLNDMASILKISDTEVNEEIQHILSAFSALNSKINNITQQETLQKQLDDFESRLPKTMASDSSEQNEAIEVEKTKRLQNISDLKLKNNLPKENR